MRSVSYTHLDVYKRQVQINGAHLAVEAPSEEEIRLGDVQENEEILHDRVRNNGPHFAGKAPSEGEIRLADVQENGDLTGKVRHEDVREKAVQKAEIRLGDVRKPDGTAAVSYTHLEQRTECAFGGSRKRGICGLLRRWTSLT